MRKLVFLDIDGVLNCYGSSGIERRCVARLNAIVEATRAEVVITSSWRESYAPEEMQQILVEHGFTGQVVGETPVLLGEARGAEIVEYLRQVDDVECFAVLDDNADLEGVAERAVMIDDFVGLSDDDVQACIALLTA